MELKELIQQKLNSAFPDANLEYSEYKNEFCVKLDKKFIVPVCSLLKEDNDLQFY